MKYLIGLLCSLEIWDGIITHWATKQGVVQEGNPLVAPMAGGVTFLVLKIAGAILCALVLWSLHRHFPRLVISASTCIITFYVIVLAWNSSMLLFA